MSVSVSVSPLVVVVSVGPVESVPVARAAMGSGAQQTFRYIGSCAGVALTIAIATSSGGGLAHGADIAMLVSAVLALVAAASVVALREQ